MRVRGTRLSLPCTPASQAIGARVGELQCACVALAAVFRLSRDYRIFTFSRNIICIFISTAATIDGEKRRTRRIDAEKGRAVQLTAKKGALQKFAAKKGALQELTAKKGGL